MTYYTASQFKEKYFVRFKDMKGGDWRVSIEVPNFSGTAIEMTGSNNPLEWMGNGEGDQTECVLGSTGTLRIMCHNTNDETYLADIRPTEANNRRVTAKRNNVIMWQGFLKMEEYNQDWEAMPYEVELPIVSALELSKSVRMRPSTTTKTVADLVRRCMSLMGINVSIYTNMPSHINYLQVEDERYWTGATVAIACQYEDCDVTGDAKYIADILDMIASPFGRVREYGSSWYFCIDRKSVIYDTDQERGEEYTISRLFKLDDTGIQFTGQSVFMPNYSLDDMEQDEFDIEGTDNQVTIIEAPESVEASVKLDDGDSNLFEMNEDFIPSKFSDCTVSDYVYYVDFDTTSDQIQKGMVSKKLLRRVVWFENNNFSVKMPVAMRFGETVDQNKTVTLNPARGILTVSGKNKVKLTINMYTLYGMEWTRFYYSDSGSGIANETMPIYLRSDDKYYAKVNGEWQWTTTRTATYLKEMNYEGELNDTSEFSIAFNEPRTATDKEHQYLHIEFYHQGTRQFMMTAKLEYTIIDNKIAALREMNKDIDKIYSYDKVSANGSGSKQKFEFKTLRGQDPLMHSENYAMVSQYPQWGFFDNFKPDTGVREMLEIGSVCSRDVTDLILYPSCATKGSKHYVTVATGMNARNCTTQLRLVSTNI